MMILPNAALLSRRQALIGLAALAGLWQPLPGLAQLAPATPSTRSAEEAAIMRVLSALAQSFNEADAEALVRDFTTDAAFVGLEGDHCQGRDEIQRMHAGWFAGKYRGAQLLVQSTKVRQVGQSSAVVDAEYLLTFPTGNAAAAAAPASVPVRARMRFVLARERLRWRVLSARKLELTPQPGE